MAESFYGLSNDTILAMGEFAILWSQFEYLFFQNDAGDKKLLNIRIIFDDADIEKKFVLELQNFQRELQLFMYSRGVQNIDEQATKKYLFTKPISMNNDVFKCVLNFLIEDSMNESDYNGGLLCIQRLRNNFLHGEKDVWNLDDQQALFNNAINVLYILCHGLMHGTVFAERLQRPIE